MQIELAGVGDAQEILDLQKLAYQSEAALNNDYSIPPLTQSLDEIKADFRQQVVFKATLDGHIVGSVRGRLRDGSCHIGRLIVDPEFQNRGIGTRLLNRIEQHFGEAQHYELFTSERSERNLYLYKKLGYRVFRTEPLTQKTTVVFLEKDGRAVEDENGWHDQETVEPTIRGRPLGDPATVSDAEVPRSKFHLIRQARLAEGVTALWMVIELVWAVWAGVAARSVALTAFGADSGIELVTALVVLRHLLLHDARATEEELDRRERQASRVVGWALYTLIGYILISSGRTFVTGARPESSLVGVALAAAALVVMPILWRWRLALAKRLSSPALRADAACSLVCAYMSATLLVGLVLNRLFGWWWADSLAALGMIWWIRGEAAEAIEAARTGCHCESCG